MQVKFPDFKCNQDKLEKLINHYNPATFPTPQKQGIVLI